LIFGALCAQSRFDDSATATATEEITAVSLVDKTHNTADRTKVSNSRENIEQLVGHLKQAAEKMKGALKTGSNRKQH
jgi:hypothetical protein